MAVLTAASCVRLRIGVEAATVDDDDMGGVPAADVTSALRQSLAKFERTYPGFLSDQALLHGVETRTSCPVTISKLPLLYLS